MAESAKCATCGNLYDPDNIRETHPYRHPVNGPIPKKEKEQGQGEEPSMHTRVQQLPSDPVLRFALIQAGVISADDLRKAEDMLAATGMISTTPRSEPSNPSGDPQADEWGGRETAAEWGRKLNESRGVGALQLETRGFEGKMDGDLELWLGDAFESWLPEKDSNEARLLIHLQDVGEIELYGGARITKVINGPVVDVSSYAKWHDGS